MDVTVDQLVTIIGTQTVELSLVKAQLAQERALLVQVTAPQNNAPGDGNGNANDASASE